MALNYNAPTEASKSSIDMNSNSDQLNTFSWLRKALIDARDEVFFSPLADVTTMPKHHGKEIVVDHYLPVLDDRNINDQGIDANGVTYAKGNMFGSSRDVGTVAGALPGLTENGGRVNRIGMSREKIRGTIAEFGFFYEWTEDAMQFDSDDQLDNHLSREAMTAALKIQEHQLQLDLLGAAAVNHYCGLAESKGELDGSAGSLFELTFDDFVRLDQILTENKAPRKTTIIAGSNYTDTRVLPASRIMYVGPEIVPMLRKLKDSFGDKAFIPVQQYAAAGSLLNGEIGSIFNFRIIEVPTMLHYEGEGAANDNSGTEGPFLNDGTNYNVYPMLVVSDKSFTSIGFNSNGKSLGINVRTKMPGSMIDRNEPYGKFGLCSYRWWYGFLALRPERIGVLWTLAKV